MIVQFIFPFGVEEGLKMKTTLSILVMATGLVAAPAFADGHSQSTAAADSTKTKQGGLHSLLDPANDPALNRECN